MTEPTIPLGSGYSLLPSKSMPMNLNSPFHLTAVLESVDSLLKGRNRDTPRAFELVASVCKKAACGSELEGRAFKKFSELISSFPAEADAFFLKVFPERPSILFFEEQAPEKTDRLIRTCFAKKYPKMAFCIASLVLESISEKETKRRMAGTINGLTDEGCFKGADCGGEATFQNGMERPSLLNIRRDQPDRPHP
ncbi:MAG: hypothetical protein PHS57_03385 [Alphaproteobacteria bacterium]|nr:hypothetical protein [Alphaproteobacteria bacterium]